MKAKKLKITGQIILVLSFLSQTLLFDFYNEESNNLEKVYTQQAIIDKGAELKEVKYFVGVLPDDTSATKEYQKVNINMAARKIALSQTMSIISSNRSKKEKTNLSNELLNRANKVNSFGAYMDFINFVNSKSISAEEIITKVEDINFYKKIFRGVFIALYIIGSGCLIASLKYSND